MKNLLFTAVAVVLLLSSCSKEEVTKSTNVDAIGFKTFVGTTTKAQDATIATLEDADVGFNVYAWHRENVIDPIAINSGFVANYMDKVEVKKTSSWTYSPLKYWPTTGYLDFLAVGNNVARVDGPGINTGEYLFTATGGGNPTIKYVCSATPANQKDLLVAESLNKTKSDGTVHFEFKHILSKIDIKVKAACTDPNLQLKINSIKFTGINGTGTYDLVNKSWSVEVAPAVINVGLNLPFSQNGNLTGNDFISPQAADGGLIIIPQAMDNIEVEYQFLQKDNDDNYTQVIVDHTGGAKITIDLTKDEPLASWEPGKKYLYNLSFEFNPAENNSVINFTVDSVTDWTSAADSDYSVN